MEKREGRREEKSSNVSQIPYDKDNYSNKLFMDLLFHFMEKHIEKLAALDNRYDHMLKTTCNIENYLAKVDDKVERLLKILSLAEISEASNTIANRKEENKEENE